jgi:hypothetical protein
MSGPSRRWRSRPWRPSRPDGPHPLEESLERVAQELAGTPAHTLADLNERFRAAVGPAMSVRATPRSLVDGVLTIEARNSTDLVELRYQRAAILEDLAVVFGPGTVREIVVVAPSRRPG